MNDKRNAQAASEKRVDSTLVTLNVVLKGNKEHLLAFLDHKFLAVPCSLRLALPQRARLFVTAGFLLYLSCEWDMSKLFYWACAVLLSFDALCRLFAERVYYK
ncbi:MAG: hypothetical protein RR716_03710 [Christensenellaceae bacterium]